MEKLNYPELVQKILTESFLGEDISPDTAVEAVFDTVRDRYLVVNLGWDDHKRVYGITVHVDIKDGKIWIQQDCTDIGVADELLAAGVPKTDIVLGFQSVYRRQFSGLAVG
ncbi:MAG: XisI protein [Okeania sp. SIO2F4]|uniref:XisI protein n=1 Tax=Okeania sp. SIO2F4 TaxID=2607790 RepID=UPI00142B38D1|nr:XisI protein [Okeania sp. SIO2F4]NES07906.1 XisI protein [Okeania sp. SIO2F4]